MKESTRSAVIASACTALVLVIVLLCLFPRLVEYLHTEVQFRSKTERARSEAKVIQMNLQQDSRFSDVTAMGVYGFNPSMLGLRSEPRTVDISFFGEVDADHVQDLKSKVEEMNPFFPPSWCITIITNTEISQQPDGVVTHEAARSAAP